MTTNAPHKPAVARYAGMKRSAEGIEAHRADARARQRANRRMRTLFPVEFAKLYGERDKSLPRGTQRQRALQELKRRHPKAYEAELALERAHQSESA